MINVRTRQIGLMEVDLLWNSHMTCTRRECVRCLQWETQEPRRKECMPSTYHYLSMYLNT